MGIDRDGYIGRLEALYRRTPDASPDDLIVLEVRCGIGDGAHGKHGKHGKRRVCRSLLGRVVSTDVGLVWEPKRAGPPSLELGDGEPDLPAPLGASRVLLPTSHDSLGLVHVPTACEHGSWQLTPREIRRAVSAPSRTLLVERHIPDDLSYLDDGNPFSWTEAERSEVKSAVEAALKANTWPPLNWPPADLSPYRLALLEARALGVISRAGDHARETAAQERLVERHAKEARRRRSTT